VDAGARGRVSAAGDDGPGAGDLADTPSIEDGVLGEDGTVILRGIGARAAGLGATVSSSNVRTIGRPASRSCPAALPGFAGAMAPGRLVDEKAHRAILRRAIEASRGGQDSRMIGVLADARDLRDHRLLRENEVAVAEGFGYREQDSSG